MAARTNVDPRDPEKIAAMVSDAETAQLARRLFARACQFDYSYNFSWLGVPIIQFPEDVIALQEIIWRVQPDLIIETGIAHGGSLIFYASMLELLGGSGRVLGIDIDIRPHNRAVIERHPLYRRITMVEGSSTDKEIAAQAFELALGKARVMVVLDSSHSHDHVLRELGLYSPLVSPGSYLVVFDTVVEDMPPGSYPQRPWDKGNNPMTAVREFLRTNREFEADSAVSGRLLLSAAPGGYLRRTGD